MNRPQVRRLLALCALGLSIAAAMGCTVGPDFQRPRFPMPGEWMGSSSPLPDQKSLTTPQPLVLVQWWKSFNDPLLTSLVERAISSNLDLAMAKARIRQARASRGVVAAGLWPQIDAGASYQRSRSSGENSGGAAPGASGRNSLERDLFQAGLDSIWELDIFGGVRRNVEASDADIQAAEEDLRDVLISLAGEVGANYVTLRGLQERIAVAGKNLKAQEHTADITHKRHEAGYVGGLDVANADAQVATTKSLIPVLEASVQGSIYNLSLLLAQEPGALLEELSVPKATPVEPPQVPVGLPSDLLRRRPDIRRAEAQLHAATARIGVATADLFPKFSLTGSLGFSSSDLTSLAGWNSRAWSIGPSVTWPLFDAGRIRSNIEVQNALEEQALLAYRKIVLLALKEVETALAAYAKEQQHRKALADAWSHNVKAVDLSMKLYVTGKSDFLNVIAAQRALYISEEALALSAQNQAADLIALYKALGGGWEHQP